VDAERKLKIFDVVINLIPAVAIWPLAAEQEKSARYLHPVD
jgi:hypothetical protein